MRCRRGGDPRGRDALGPPGRSKSYLTKVPLNPFDMYEYVYDPPLAEKSLESAGDRPVC